MKANFIGVWMVICVGCAGPAFVTQPLYDEPSLFIGLTKHQTSENAAEASHDHPVEWAEEDLFSILKRLHIRQGGGLMDSSRPQQTVFSAEDLSLLVPGLRQAFALARPSDLIVFALWGSSSPSQTLEVTSGGTYLEAKKLHIVLSNHRERVSSEQEGVKRIRNNPFYSLRDKQGTLTFFPAGYVIDSRMKYMAGGFDSPASEIVLDYQALLEIERPMDRDDERKTSVLENSGAGSTPRPSPEREVEILREEISDLKSELSRIKQQIIQQKDESSGPKPSHSDQTHPPY